MNIYSSLIVVIITTLLFSALSCDSPSDVLANRTIITSDISTVEVASPENGDYGVSGITDTTSFSFVLQNISPDQSVVLRSIRLAKGNQGFSFSESQFPDTLFPRTSMYSNAEFTLRFTPPSLGVFEDEVIVNSSTAKRFRIKVTVTTIGNDTVSIDNDDSALSIRLSPQETEGKFSFFTEFGRHNDTLITITNLSNKHRILIPSVTMDGDISDFELINLPHLPFIIGKSNEISSSMSFTLRYTPTVPNLPSQVTISFGTQKKYMLTVCATGYEWDTISVNSQPTLCRITPTDLVFGDVAVGTTARLDFQVQNLFARSNYGGNSLLLPSMIRLRGSPDFFIDEGTFPLVLPPAEVRTLSLYFRPSSVGAKNCSFQIGTTHHKIMVSGKGIPTQ